MIKSVQQMQDCIIVVWPEAGVEIATMLSLYAHPLDLCFIYQLGNQLI